jgi:hypothetical protein
MPTNTPFDAADSTALRLAIRTLIVSERARGCRHTMLHTLDDMCAELTAEIDAWAPEMDLGRPFVARPVAVGISKRMAP